MYLSPCEFGDRTDGHDYRDCHEQFLPIERSHDLECRNLCIRRKELMKWLCIHTAIIRYNPDEGHTFQGNRRREVDCFGSIWKEDQKLEDTPIHSVQTEVQTTPINIFRNRIQTLTKIGRPSGKSTFPKKTPSDWGWALLQLSATVENSGSNSLHKAHWYCGCKAVSTTKTVNFYIGWDVLIEV